MDFSRPGLWTGLLGGVAATVGAMQGRVWEALALGLLAGVVVSLLEGQRRA